LRTVNSIVDYATVEYSYATVLVPLPYRTVLVLILIIQYSSRMRFGKIGVSTPGFCYDKHGFYSFSGHTSLYEYRNTLSFGRYSYPYRTRRIKNRYRTGSVFPKERNSESKKLTRNGSKIQFLRFGNQRTISLLALYDHSTSI
jgi:hypothetical protein